MQPLVWYVRRLRAMSPAELAWRARCAIRDGVDWYRVTRGRPPSAAVGVARASDATPGFRVCDVEVGEWASPAAGEMERAWCQRLADQAEQIVRRRLSFFNLGDCNVGDPVDWNRDLETGRKSPLRFARMIDYRDHEVTGDSRVVWELNRHHHLVVLGRAYRSTGDVRYASELVRQIEGWLEQCPYGLGVNWRSPLELSIRLINWVWAVDLIRESGAVTREFSTRLLDAAYLHMWEVTRRYSHGSSANNHRIGEAAGVLIGTSYFDHLPSAPRWRAESREVLCQEILAQTYPDGGGREQALGYQLFILEFLLAAGVVARRTGWDFPAEYWQRLEKMVEFVGALSEGGSAPPMFGDNDQGRVLDLGCRAGDASGLLCTGSVLFGRPDFKKWACGYAEPARWLLGQSSVGKFEAIESRPAEEPLCSRAFPDSGYYLLQDGQTGTRDRVSVVFDCGELGFKAIAAHGHADALSFTLRAFGAEIFVDPGTYDYFRFPSWREYFRSTRAHNTVVVDEADQSAPLGSFLWGARARARCIRWEPRADGGMVVGEHDGYTRLADPVVHRRSLALDGGSRMLTIRDELSGRRRHTLAVYFHVSEECEVSAHGSNQYQIRAGGGTVTLEVDRRLSVRTLRGSEDPLGGWVSRGYHQKVPAVTLAAVGAFEGCASFVSRVRIGAP